MKVLVLIGLMIGVFLFMIGGISWRRRCDVVYIPVEVVKSRGSGSGGGILFIFFVITATLIVLL